MADMRVFSKINSVGRNPNTNVGWRGTPDGGGIVVPWVTALAMEGRVFHVSSGSVSTPVSFPTSYTSTSPQLVVDVPSGTTIIPLRVMVHEETSTGTINEVIVLSSSSLVTAGTSTALTQKSARTDQPITSGCSCYGIMTSGTAPTIIAEFYRAGYAFLDSTTNPRAVYEYDASMAPWNVIVGPGALVVYVNGGTASTGFTKATWIELPSATAITA